MKLIRHLDKVYVPCHKDYPDYKAYPNQYNNLIKTLKKDFSWDINGDKDMLTFKGDFPGEIFRGFDIQEYPNWYSYDMEHKLIQRL